MKQMCLFVSMSLVCNTTLVTANTIVVGIGSELMSAAASLSPNDTLLLRDGTYSISDYAVVIRTRGVVVKGMSGDREKVIVAGAGMSGGIDHGFWVAADKVTIRDMTIRNVRYHCIQTDVNTDSLRVINCVLRDAGEQLLKVPFNASEPDPSENGLVEMCLFEFSAGVAFQGYTGGIDCHFAKDWVVRNNVFKYIRSPENAPAEHAVHFWTNSENTLVENNVIIDCDRGIGFGLGSVAHIGGIIRNNMIYHRAIGGTDNADAGITLETCADARVYNNTVFFENDYPNAIEYRFAATSNVLIVNNLTNKAVRERDGASGTVLANVTAAQADWFRSASTGDLHLSSRSIAAVVDKGTAVLGLSTDIDGDSRPQGSGIDIGADEYADAGISGKQRLQADLPGSGHHGLFFMVTGRGNGPMVMRQVQAYDIMGRHAGNRVYGSGVYFRREK
ncbi:MAG: right-handed parallel beta-helix repeat-containing protein [Chitinispirillaceae bacterium]|nr:right-handed parallel beta-helix repeat-containing protein [Chitinispirillaceae bacterium]